MSAVSGFLDFELCRHRILPSLVIISGVIDIKALLPGSSKYDSRLESGTLKWQCEVEIKTWLLPRIQNVSRSQMMPRQDRPERFVAIRSQVATQKVRQLEAIQLQHASIDVFRLFKNNAPHRSTAAIIDGESVTRFSSNTINSNCKILNNNFRNFAICKIPQTQRPNIHVFFPGWLVGTFSAVSNLSTVENSEFLDPCQID